MKTSKFILLGMLLLAMMAAGCSSDDDGEKYSKTIRNFLNSGCKKMNSNVKTKVGTDQDDNKEIIRYKALKSGYLRLTHLNVMFHCETTITVNASIADGTIIIDENAPDVTDCVCRYDLTMEIGPLENREYNVIINNNNYKHANFTFNYSSSSEGEFSVNE